MIETNDTDRNESYKDQLVDKEEQIKYSDLADDKKTCIITDDKKDYFKPEIRVSERYDITANKKKEVNLIFEKKQLKISQLSF